PTATQTARPTSTNTPSPTPTCPPVWSVVPGTNPGSNDNVLNAVAVVSANDIWAVGYRSDGVNDGGTLVAHWDGARWSVVPSPDPGLYNYFTGVVAVSTNDVWAVGWYVNDHSGPQQTLVEHWNGSGWSVVPSPRPSPYNSGLDGIAAVSANDIWAVGSYLPDSSGPHQTLIEHWDGSRWSVVPSPNMNSFYNNLKAVAAVSADDIWAVGEYGYNLNWPYWTLVEHWNGSSWTVVPSHDPGSLSDYLDGVAAVSANDVWTV